MTRLALVVEDDALTRDALATLLGLDGYDVRTAEDLAAAEAALDDGAPLDLAILDLGLPDGDGLTLVPRLAALASRPSVVVLTGETRLERAVEAMRLGASDFQTKPLDPTRLRLALARIDKELAERDEQARLRRELIEVGCYHGLVGRSPEMRRVFDTVERVAPSELPLYLTGESGTGKELLARALHLVSRRRRGPFVALNCGAIPRQLAESELFGHELGAFTGAHRQHVGAFERAHGGTLFLDELTEMPLELQVVLLRVLGNRTFQRVGGSRELHTDVRVIAASNRDPLEAVREGRLREDLYFRLHVMPIALPPLRKRRDDVLLLTEHFLRDGLPPDAPAPQLSAAARAALLAHRWPGNVRELRNAVARAAVLCADGVIEAADLGLGEAPALHPGVGPSAPSGGATSLARHDGVFVPLGTTLADAERLIVEATLRKLSMNRTQTSRALGISPKTLYNKCRAWGLGGRDEPVPDE